MRKRGFNLLRPQMSEEDKWDKIYNWISSTARVIVIITEIVVVGVFVVRVVVDRRSRELDKILEANASDLDALKTVEAEIRNIQDDTKDYNAMWNASDKFGDVIDEIYSYDDSLTPYITAEINGNGEVDVSGIGYKTQVNQLEMSMKDSDKYSSVQLESFRPGIDDDFDKGTFRLTAKLKSFKRIPLAQLYKDK